MKSALDIWNYLEKSAGLDIQRYDMELEQQILNNLPLKPEYESCRKSSLVQSLPSVSVEDFIVSFFLSMQPYAQMLADLLWLFEQVGAKHSNNNLSVEFNFDKSRPALKFNLEHFREAKSIWQTIKEEWLTCVWSDDQLWALTSIFRNCIPAGLETTRHDLSWLRKFPNNWPSSLPDAPMCGYAELDLMVTRLWQIWNKVVYDLKLVGGRHILRQFRALRSDTLLQNAPNWFSPQSLAEIEADHWSSAFYDDVSTAMEFMKSSADEHQRNELLNSIHEFENSLPKTKSPKERLVETLVDFLNLPIWKARHALYSAWIFHEIVSSIGIDNVEIYAPNEQISFTFARTHLASTIGFEVPLRIWSELKSPLKDPIGKGRTSNIQPDYSIGVDPVTSSEKILAVIECKQYLRPSKGSFVRALTDYARGCLNAQVMLVNYGKTDTNLIVGAVSSETIRDRIHVIGDLTISNEHSRQELKRFLTTTLAQYLVKPSKRRIHKTNARYTSTRRAQMLRYMEFRLDWNGTPSDLDIHLIWESSKGTTEHIYFRKKGSAIEEPYAVLQADTVNGVPEIMKLIRWDSKASYKLLVHNYSRDDVFDAANAKVTLVSAKSQLEILCPLLQIGNWWHVCTIGPGNNIKIINEISNKNPFGSDWD